VFTNDKAQLRLAFSRDQAQQMAFEPTLSPHVAGTHQRIEHGLSHGAREEVSRCLGFGH
jgi:hypothetical protein